MRRSRPFLRRQSWAKTRHTNRVNQIYLLGWRWTCNPFLLHPTTHLSNKEPWCYMLRECFFASKWKPEISVMLLRNGRYGIETSLSEPVYIIANHRKTYRKTNIGYAAQCHWSSMSYLTVFQESPIFQLQVTFAALQEGNKSVFNPTKSSASYFWATRCSRVSFDRANWVVIHL